ncbi:MAG TPA: redoxin domain-containing protein [Verrucomicrobiales bacterium]|nr:redoxin domain-containing protein [Verrucomicrobiales bacterium]
MPLSQLRCVLLILLFSGNVLPAAAARTIDNFALLDHRGKSHELDYYLRAEGIRGIVLFVQGNGCPLVRKRIPELQRLRAAYEPRGILFAMLNANPQDGRDEVAEEAERFQIDVPILMDEAQLAAGMLGVQRTAEAFLISAGSKEIVFRGPIDDRLGYQSEKPQAEREFLREALDAFLAGEPVEPAEVDAPGCLIAMPEAGPAISYAGRIAPVLLENCVRCHVEGGIGPFALSSYAKVRGWSKMIREVLLTRQMPPWQADPHHGDFANGRSLHPEEQAALVHWIDAGCPRGDGPDPLAGREPSHNRWALGEPDALIDIGEQHIPAEGILDYRYAMVESPFQEDTWISAVDVKPGNPSVLHHVIASIYVKDDKGEWTGRRHLAGYAPGMGASKCPQGSGILVPGGAHFRFQLHYTVSGREETDRSQLALYTADGPLEREYHTGVAIHSRFRIPPGAMEYEQMKENAIQRDILLYAMNPHMHFRGKWMCYEAHYGDGRVETLLSVPNYNFNWQRDYELAEPKRLPAGTKLVVRGAWDNSPMNLHNPDPNRAVGWGEQTFDEMFFASYRFVDAD